MPRCRLYYRFAGPSTTWQVGDFADERQRGCFIARHRHALSAWAIDDECMQEFNLVPPPHLKIVTAEVRAAMHGRTQ